MYVCNRVKTPIECFQIAFIYIYKYLYVYYLFRVGMSDTRKTAKQGETEVRKNGKKKKKRYRQIIVHE